MEQLQFEFGYSPKPKLDKKRYKAAVMAALAEYRSCKYRRLLEREASITAGYTERFHGPTNQTSDQTADIAIHNVDERERRRLVCELVERAVEELPSKEEELIRLRYMTKEFDYISDKIIYELKMDPPISADTYDKIRLRAFKKLADAGIAIYEEDKE